MIFTHLPQFETKRLLLRKLVGADATALYEILSDPEVTQYTPRHPHQSLEETKELLTQWLSLYEQDEVSRWGVEHKIEQKVIGVCGFITWEKRDRRAEIAYISARNYWGQGYMTEAVEAVIRFGFEEMGLNRVEALCEPENKGSIRVLEKAGMRYEGRLREYQFDKGVFHTVDMYAILKRDWEAAVG